jgi:hypothetical protein
MKLNRVAEELVTSILQGQLGTLKQGQSLGTQVTGLSLERPDLDRIAWRNIYATNGVGTFKGRGCGLTADQ